MEKLAFSNLNIELTRRCNLQCKHCLKGEAQNIDLSNEAIDNLLNQTIGIENILFTGGEPFLAIDKMRYFLHGIKERNIILGYVSVVTNGTIINNDVVKIIRDYDDYIRNLRKRINKKEFVEKLQKEPYFDVTISDDKYHDNDVVKSLKWFNSKFKGVAERQITGEAIVSCGRAVKIIEAAEESFARKNLTPRICLYGKGRKTFCRAVPKDRKEPDYLTAMCSLNITATGYLIGTQNVSSIEEDEPYRRICDLNKNEPIIEKIDEFNGDKRLLCFEVDELGDRQHQNSTPESLMKWIIHKHDHQQKLLSVSMKPNETYDQYIKRMQSRRSFKEYLKESERAKQVEKDFNTEEKYKILAEYRHSEVMNIWLKYRYLTNNECKLYENSLKYGKLETCKILEDKNNKRKIYRMLLDELMNVNRVYNDIVAIRLLKDKMNFDNDELIKYLKEADPQLQTDAEKIFRDLPTEFSPTEYFTVAKMKDYYLKIIVDKLSEIYSRIKTGTFCEDDIVMCEQLCNIYDELKAHNIIPTVNEIDNQIIKYKQTIPTMRDMIGDKFQMKILKLFGGLLLP